MAPERAAATNPRGMGCRMTETCGHVTQPSKLARHRRPGPPCRHRVAFGSTRCAAGHEISPSRWAARAASLVSRETILAPMLDADALCSDLGPENWADHDYALGRLKQHLLGLESTEDWEQYLDAQAKFHSYSSNNVALILEQRPTATHVANDLTWAEVGRTVRPGEHPIYIWAPTLEMDDRPDPERPHRPYALNELRPGFRRVPVFDVSQTEGRPLPKGGLRDLPGAAPQGSYEGLVGVAQQLGFTVYNHDFGTPGINGETHIRARSILISETQQDAHRVKTLAHELGHAILHNGDDVRYWRMPRAKAEMEAESVAYVVCHALGMSTGRYSAPYAAIWAGGGSNAADEIMDSATHIKKASRRILAAFRLQQEATT